MPSPESRFRVRAFGDRVLVDGKIRYMLFFESDEPFRGGVFKWAFKLFPTRNGWHVVAEETGTAQDKLEWFACWKALYPDSDYKLDRWNFLRPHTKEEAKFILTRSGSVPQTCWYYRDKLVVDSWLRNRASR